MLAKFGAVYYMVGGIISVLAGIVLLVMQDWAWGIGAVILGAILFYLNWRKLKALKKQKPAG